MESLRELVDRAHATGIKMILDQVANHTGPSHPWAADPPTPTWLNGSVTSHLPQSSELWTLADPYSTPQMQSGMLEGWFVNRLPDINQNDPEAARYLVQNTLWWIGSTGIDGVRLDTVPYVPRRFWREWSTAVKREYPAFKTVGEVYDRNPSVVASFQETGKTGIDSVFDFPLYFALRRAFAEGLSLREVPMTLAQDRLFPNPSTLVTFLGLHDVPRFANDPAALKLAFTLLFTTRGIPLIYYGDEIGMAGAGDPDNRRDFPGGWAEDRRSAFEAIGRTPAEQSIWESVRGLTRLRAESHALRRGKLMNLAVDDQFYCFARVAGGETVVIAMNNAPKPYESDVYFFGVEGNRIRVSLGPRSAAVYRLVGHRFLRYAPGTAR